MRYAPSSKLHSLPVDVYLAEYVKSKRAQKKPIAYETVDRYRKALRAVKRTLGRTPLLLEVTPTLLADVHGKMVAAGQSWTSARARCGVLSTLARHAGVPGLPRKVYLSPPGRRSRKRPKARKGPFKTKRQQKRRNPAEVWPAELFGVSLQDAVTEYVAGRNCCPKYQSRLRNVVSAFGEWQASHGGDRAGTALLNGWLASLSESLKPATVNGCRQMVLGLVRFALPDGQPLPRADRVRRQREPDAVKPAFTREEFLRMVQAAPGYTGRPTRAFTWSAWWEAFVRGAYDSGQYVSDLRRLRWNELRDDGSATIVRHKTGRFISFSLKPKTIDAARRLGSTEFVFPWRWNVETYFPEQFALFVRHAGVRPLTAKSLRRSAITYTYIEQGPEAARMLAGHASFATTAKHYIDWSIAKPATVKTPDLCEPAEQEAIAAKIG